MMRRPVVYCSVLCALLLLAGARVTAQEFRATVKGQVVDSSQAALPGATVKLSKTPARVGVVPTPGQHTDEVLGGLLGYGDLTVRELRNAGAIA